MLILHLSDIHFRKSEIGSAQDRFFHLRNELLRDVQANCERLGAPDVIIVSGDVAFAGDPDEYAFATEWLRRLCDASGGSMDTIFVVPGNHDVVRASADRNLVQMVHRTIKEAADPTAEIARQMMDPDARRLLYESLDNYNAFALQFFCDLLPPDRTRATRDVVLNDGSLLRLWGLNTAFVSSSRDRQGSLFVDPASLQITRDYGVVNLVVAHHHLSWLGQARPLEDHLNDVAPIQIFGHVHTNRIDMNRDYLRLTASAVNPDLEEAGAEPGYNLLHLSVDGPAHRRKLKLTTHVRVWQTAPGGFQAKMDKSSPTFEHEIALEPWSPPATPVGSPGATGTIDAMVEIAAAITAVAQTADGRREMSMLRDVGLRFYRLSFSKKSEIAGRLDLFEEDDVRQPDYERFRQVFLRACARGRLAELAEAVRLAEQG